MNGIRERRQRHWDRIVTERLVSEERRGILIDRALRRAVKGNLQELSALSAAGVNVNNLVRDAAIAQDKALLLSGEATTRTTSNRRIEIKSEEHITLSVADQRRRIDAMLNMERQLREAGAGNTIIEGEASTALPAIGDGGGDNAQLTDTNDVTSGDKVGMIASDSDVITLPDREGQHGSPS